ncbi:hypothetical protein HYH03_017013 [Edaphochlamys debaryana]|uniref:Uncharacterized protein n=1 Tax=Edaphochlamys debaryana TaxID=47281 RepID=A0A835XNF5_9CHLO|nr:hypothetical protein HYH03_017013 [Edaphochlamys debaryana]|eukprot:KAG2484130.1 hypothetical protein HYH03_017013 [Edaphochlamys debaryana]
MGCGASSTKGVPPALAAAGAQSSNVHKSENQLPAVLDQPSPAANGTTPRPASATQSGKLKPAASIKEQPPAKIEQAPSVSRGSAVLTGVPSRRVPLSRSNSLAAAAAAGVNDAASRPAPRVARFGSAPLSCLVPLAPPLAGAAPTALPAETAAHLVALAGGDAAARCAAAAHVRGVLCSEAHRGAGGVQALLDAKALEPLVRVVKAGPQAARLDAVWALTNIAASPVFRHAEDLADEPGCLESLVALVNNGRQRPGFSQSAGRTASGRPASGTGAGAAATAVGPQPPEVVEQAVWALGNVAGAQHPDHKQQALADQVLEAGALKAVLGVMAAEADAGAGRAAGGGGGGGPLVLRTATWCLQNLGKHKREKEMVDAIPLVTRLLQEAGDVEVLTCCAWVLAYLGSNEDNKSHLKQALPALPRLVQWVREASSSLATPSLFSLGTMCTGYMKALDYSQEVVEAGGVPAMLSFLKTASVSAKRDMVKEALFALSNVAGANNATVKAMLDAGVFPDVIALLRASAGDEEIVTECLYVLTNPWDPLVGIEVPTAQGLLDAGILQELSSLLVPTAPPERLGLVLKGLADGLKRGQQLMTHAANMMLLEHGREGMAELPPPKNPIVELYVSLGTVKAIESFNAHPDEDVATRANGIMSVLQFFMT